MIGSLKGIIVGLYEDRLLLEVGGVGYVVGVGAKTHSRINIGDAVFLFIETQVREDSIKLFGFLSDIERAWFVRLQDVSGVGAKVALAILDIMTPSQIVQAVEIQDKIMVGRASGVGPKLAQRIITELKGRTMPNSLLAAQTNNKPIESSQEIEIPSMVEYDDMNIRNDAVSALQNLGISGPEAMSAVAAAITKFETEPNTSELLKQALKELKR